MRDRAWIVTVPAIVLLGFTSGWLSNSGYGNQWFDRLAKPSFMPPGWAFPVAWTTLYVLMGVAVGLVIASRSGLRRSGLIAFGIQLVLNLAWSPIFFGLHQAKAAFAVIVLMLVVAALATTIFWYIRRLTALLMLPYLGWLVFAACLNLAIVRLNP